MRFAIATALAALLLAGSPAPADEGHGALAASNPIGILRAMRAAGYTAEIGEDSYGDPQIQSEISHSKFMVRFYNCEAGANCGTIQLRASYDLNEPVSVESMNSWNQNKLYGRAYLSAEGHPVVEHVVSMREDGIGPGNFKWVLGTWGEVIREFETYVGYR